MNRNYFFLVAAVVLAIAGCANGKQAPSSKESAPAEPSVETASQAPAKASGKTAEATFAGGCFWCMEGPFEKLKGVHSVVSGYCGGHVKDPTYKQVTSGETGHAEAVRIVYDPRKVSYETLLDAFWMSINPTTKDRQFADVGSQYRTAIFYHDESQRKAAEASKRTWEERGIFGAPIVTEITRASTFYEAEEYHQDYYKKNPIRYKYYRYGSGRTPYLENLWEKGPGKKYRLKKS